MESNITDIPPEVLFILGVFILLIIAYIRWDWVIRKRLDAGWLAVAEALNLEFDSHRKRLHGVINGLEVKVWIRRKFSITAISPTQRSPMTRVEVELEGRWESANLRYLGVSTPPKEPADFDDAYKIIRDSLPKTIVHSLRTPKVHTRIQHLLRLFQNVAIERGTFYGENKGQITDPERLMAQIKEIVDTALVLKNSI